MAESIENEKFIKTNIQLNRSYESWQRICQENKDNYHQDPRSEISEHDLLLKQDHNERNDVKLIHSRNRETRPSFVRSHDTSSNHTRISEMRPPHQTSQVSQYTHDIRPQTRNLEQSQHQMRLKDNRPYESEQMKRARKWSEYFTENPREFLRLDYHRISRLKEIDQNKPNAQFKCLVCGYYCDTLHVVNSHIEGLKHLRALQNHFNDSTLSAHPPVPPSQVAVINETLETIASHHVMSRSDCRDRKGIANYVNNIVNKTFPGYTVGLYGSSDHGMGLKLSDVNLDLTVSHEINYSRVLEDVVDVLKEDPAVQNVQRHYDWECPHVLFYFKKTGTQCHLRLNNEKAIALTTLLKLYASIDTRVCKLAALVRFWAMISHVADPEAGTLSGYYLYLFVICFLQQLPKPVLPVLNELYSDDSSQRIETLKLLEMDFTDLNAKWKTENNETLGELWIGFFKFFAVNAASPDFYVSITQSEKLGAHKFNRFFIIDPINEQNIRTPNNRCHFIYIMHCIKTTFLYFVTPQTSRGPIFGAIKEKPTSEDCPPLQQYVERHIVATHHMLQTLPLVGSVYNKTGNPSSRNIQARVHGFLEALHHPENFYNYKILHTRGKADPSNPQDIIVRLANDTVVFSEDAAYLVPLVKKEKLEYDFSLQRFTCGKLIPYFCIICKRDGHTKDRCEDTMFSKQDPLPTPEPEVFTTLDVLCQDVYANNILTEDELKLRGNIVLELEEVIKEIYDDAKLTLFGSSRNGFGVKGSDLDICVIFSKNPTGTGLDLKTTIQKLYDALYFKNLKNINELSAIPTAKVPIVKFKHIESNLVGDLSLYNTLGEQNTRLLNTYAEIDPRVVVVGIMMKKFVKECLIANASKGTLSSYAYTLMVIYFLQRCTVPVLPVLQELSSSPGPLPEKIVQGWNLYFFDDLENLHKAWPGFGKNTDSVGHLWLELLCFYTEKFDTSGQVVSIRKFETVRKASNSRCITIEDPFEVTHNLGASVSRRVNAYIFQTFSKGRTHFSSLPKTNQLSLEDYYFDKEKLTEGDLPVGLHDRYKGVSEVLKLLRKEGESEQNEKIPQDKTLNQNSVNSDVVSPPNLQRTIPGSTKFLIPEPNRSQMNVMPYPTTASSSVWPFKPNLSPPAIMNVRHPNHHITKPEYLHRPPVPLPFANKNACVNVQECSLHRATEQNNGVTFPAPVNQIPNQRHHLPPFNILKSLPTTRPPTVNQSESRMPFAQEIRHPKFNTPNRVYDSHLQTAYNREHIVKDSPDVHHGNLKYYQIKDNKAESLSPALYMTNQRMNSSQAAILVLPEHFTQSHAQHTFLPHTRLNNIAPNHDIDHSNYDVNCVDLERESWRQTIAKLCSSYGAVATEDNRTALPLDKANCGITPNMQYVNEVEMQTRCKPSDRTLLEDIKEL